MSKRNKIIILICSLIVIILTIMELFFNKTLTNIDLYISNSIWSLRNDKLVLILNGVSFLGGVEFMIVMSFIIMILERNVLFGIGIGIDTLINKIFKITIKRDRPSNILIVDHEYSFPSGHSMASMFFYGYIIYKIKNSNMNTSLKRLFIILLILLILLIGFSRLYLGAHYLSDILCGYSLSIILLIIFIYISNKIKK